MKRIPVLAQSRGDEADEKIDKPVLKVEQK
jgi:hypothetical protein